MKIKILHTAYVIGFLFFGIQVTYAQSPAQANKVLKIAFIAPDDGFDPIKSSNLYSSSINEVIFERLLDYDYLARPVKLVPSSAVAMPVVQEEGKKYIFKIKPGIYFSDDAAFKGKARELVAEDYIYTIKRIIDPENRSPIYSFIDGKIAGVDAALAQAKKNKRFNYDQPIAGLKALDKYTLEITLTRPDYNFPYILAYPGFGAQAREVVEYYKKNIALHPVGTGPYQLGKYVPRSKIELIANPKYRGFVWNFKSTGTAWDNQLVKDMQGKKMPQIGKVTVNIIEEEQSRWLAFQSKQLDYSGIVSSAVPKVLDGEKLKPAFQKQGIQLFRNKMPEIVMFYFNMRDPLVGGYSNDKIALRRAIAMAFNHKEFIKLSRQGQSVKAEMIIPDGVNGHNPKYKSSIGYNPTLANKLLDYYGYKKGSDGYRTLPNGQALVLKMNTEGSSASVLINELWKKNLDAIGINIEFKVSNFADNMKAANQCKYMMWGGAWTADYPEGENFVQQLYGPKSGQGNNSCYQSKAYDALYRQAMHLTPDKRLPYYEKMNRQMEADTPWVLIDTRINNWLVQPYVKGFKAHPINNTPWQYLDIAPTR